MSKVIMTKKRTFAAIIAVVLAVVIMLGGTFAWQSINQTALNEVYSTVNPGGRLHDDYVDITYGADEIADYPTMTFNKDVYVENFTSLSSNGVQIYARVRLDEYMEIGKNAGQADSEATSIVANAVFGDKSTWTTHIMNNDNDPFHKYWEWDLAGKTMYMPTFNKDKNSLEAEINGVFPDFESTYTDYAGVTDKFIDVTEKTGDAVYTRDDQGNVTKSIKETHTVKETLDSAVISMEEYQRILSDGNPDNDTGNFWVWDADGWAYWASPILPDSATGLLLDQIKRTEVIIDEDWYYAINVVAQFITKDDIGYKDATGFYADDQTVSPEALVLLDKIGVQVTYEVNTADELAKAVANGGNIVVKNDIVLDTPLVINKDTVLNLGNHTISNTEAIFNDDAAVRNWSLISVAGEDVSLVINGGNFAALENDCYAVDVRDGATVTINGGTFNGNISAVYVHSGNAIINAGEFKIQQTSNGSYNYMLNALDENYNNGTATIKVYGGTFHGFNPATANDGSYLADGYVVTQPSAGVYTVVAE